MVSNPEWASVRVRVGKTVTVETLKLIIFYLMVLTARVIERYIRNLNRALKSVQYHVLARFVCVSYGY